jgi:type I site-specific restriction endonuclease
MESRNRFIVDIIVKCTKEDRKILVLSDRRSHVKTLFGLLENAKVDFTFGLFLGGMKTVDLEKSRRSRVILATYSAFKEGISEKDLNTLLLITPKKFIGHLKNTTKNESGQLNQIVGRIFRKAHIDVIPLIIDFQDNFSVYRSQAAGRNKFYKEHFTNATFEKCIVNLDELNENSNENESENENEMMTKCCIVDY